MARTVATLNGARSNPGSRLVHSTLLCIAMLLPARPLASAPALPAAAEKRILVLSTQVAGWAGHQIFERALEQALEARLGVAFDLHLEYIDAERSVESASMAALRDFLSAKYGLATPHVIVTFGYAANNFMVENYEELFPRTPVLFNLSGGHGPVGLPAHFTGRFTTIELGHALQLAFSLQPEIERVFVVSGAAPVDRHLEAMARGEFGPYERARAFHYLAGLSIEQLEKTVATLPDRSMIFYLGVTQDGTGQRFTSAEAFARIAAAAPVPIYCGTEALLGRGCVGTYSVDLTVAAHDIADRVVRILQGEKVASIPLETLQPDRTVIDWHMVRRWDIDPGRIPANSVLLNRQVAGWVASRGELLALLVLLTVQAGIIVALMAQRTRRRCAQRLATRADAELRSSHDRIQDLARRLITAQEAERVRIARELHDDVNQILAALSIRLSELQQDLPAGHGELRAKVEWLQQRASTLVEMIRALSHELHPGALRHAGLVAALRSACAEVAGPSGIAVHFRTDQAIIELPDDVALTLYRIAQEALHNVVRHACAQRVQVCLSQNEREVCLEIVDDGRGFLPALQLHAGLGLASMRERMALLNGRLEIDSVPGSGTRIMACVSRPIITRVEPASAIHAGTLPALN